MGRSYLPGECGKTENVPVSISQAAYQNLLVYIWQLMWSRHASHTGALTSPSLIMQLGDWDVSCISNTQGQKCVAFARITGIMITGSHPHSYRGSGKSTVCIEQLGQTQLWMVHWWRGGAELWLISFPPCYCIWTVFIATYLNENVWAFVWPLESMYKYYAIVNVSTSQ